MRKILCAVLLLGGIESFGVQDVSACGDKFLLAGRGGRHQHAYCAVHPASILIYINPKSPRAKSMGDSEFLNALKLAGHKPQTAASPVKFAELVSSGGYDIVLVDYPDAAALKAQVERGETVPAKPVLLPILYKPSDADVTAAQHQFGTVLKAPDGITHVLGVIDDVMKVHRNGVKAATF